MGGKKMHVTELDGPPPPGTPVAVADHCYACTAGSGFTWGGAITTWVQARFGCLPRGTMTMKVKVKGYFNLADAMGGQDVLEVENKDTATIKNLLDYLSHRFGKALTDLIIDPDTEDFSGHITLLVNGFNYRSMPDGLDTKLKDGDEVSLFPPLAGG